MAENILTEFDSFFFLGIGGVSMSALAKILYKSGKTVAGCDRSESEYTEELANLGIDVEIANFCDIEEYDVVVYTDALPENNPAIIQARRLNKVLMPRGRLLYEVSRLFNNTVAVAGCHGKTTCTAMIAHVFKAAGKQFSSHIGGSDLTFTNGYLDGYDYFVTEACEYKKNFLYLKPDIAVILNSDADHLDCYGTAKNLADTYKKFAEGSGEVIKLFGDLEDCNGITFGFDDRATFYAKSIRNVGGKFAFTAYEGNNELGKVTLSSYGKHNVLNALAAIAVARCCGIAFEDIAEGLKSFKGVKRRFEKIGEVNGAVCIADYAHHPNEIKAALKTARLVTRGELYVVFQPHTYSRTKNFFKQFVLVLSQVKRLMVYKTFAAREYYDDAGSALTLSKGLKRSVYGDCETDIEQFISGAKEGDTVLFLGAGDIYEVAKTVIDG
ncbi:MAG: UDP-N-acetylmuramate--L-alanine ligase [Clostridia bacterium]|nr:UDP-N-acetylmuramate--L-alanine ligase [Clostridia bacterium]